MATIILKPGDAGYDPSKPAWMYPNYQIDRQETNARLREFMKDWKPKVREWMAKR